MKRHPHDRPDLSGEWQRPQREGLEGLPDGVEHYHWRDRLTVAILAIMSAILAIIVGLFLAGKALSAESRMPQIKPEMALGSIKRTREAVMVGWTCFNALNRK